MTYPFGADRAELEKAFSLPTVQADAASAPDSERQEPIESDRAVALFEHPEH